jgi:hypothetical protein
MAADVCILYSNKYNIALEYLINITKKEFMLNDNLFDYP